MNYLKLFEDFSGDFYSEIGANEFDEIIWSSTIEDANLNKSDSDKLKRFIKSRGLNYKFMVSGTKPSLAEIKPILPSGMIVNGSILTSNCQGHIQK